VVRQTFQFARCGWHTQSNITNIISPKYITPTHTQKVSYTVCAYLNAMSINKHSPILLSFKRFTEYNHLFKNKHTSFGRLRFRPVVSDLNDIL
jgi:hypothetical protein